MHHLTSHTRVRKLGHHVTSRTIRTIRTIRARKEGVAARSEECLG
jgi:hypothetical protein